MSFLKIWGYNAYVKRKLMDKLEPKTDKCFYLGYPKFTIGYYSYNRTEGKVFVTKNGTFLEKEFLSKGVSGRTVQLDEIRESPPVVNGGTPSLDVPAMEPEVEETPDGDTSIEVATGPSRSGRTRTVPSWYSNEVLLLDNNEPATHKEAMMGPESNKWLGAMESEIDSMYEN